MHLIYITKELEKRIFVIQSEAEEMVLAYQESKRKAEKEYEMLYKEVINNENSYVFIFRLINILLIIKLLCFTFSLSRHTNQLQSIAKR